MAQALTLDFAQNIRVRRYLCVRHNYIKDSTIFISIFHKGLQAKALAALCAGNSYDLDGAVRNAFI